MEHCGGAAPPTGPDLPARRRPPSPLPAPQGRRLRLLRYARAPDAKHSLSISTKPPSVNHVSSSCKASSRLTSPNGTRVMSNPVQGAGGGGRMRAAAKGGGESADAVACYMLVTTSPKRMSRVPARPPCGHDGPQTDEERVSGSLLVTACLKRIKRSCVSAGSACVVVTEAAERIAGPVRGALWRTFCRGLHAPSSVWGTS